MKLDFRLGHFVFRGRLPMFGRAGAYISEAEGWKDGVDIRRASLDRQQADGEFPSQGFGTARVVSWWGRWYAESDWALDDAGDQFAALLAGGGYERLFADEPNGTLWGDAGLVSSTFKPIAAGFPIARYSISLKLPDPRKYGETNRFPVDGRAAAGVSVDARHYGQTTAWPQFEVTGSAPGYRINGPGGRTYVVTRALAGETHLVDMKTGRLYVNGAQVLGGIARADRWGIGAGQTVSAVLVISSGSASMRQIVKDTN